jgi:hypothetical protein
VEVFQDEFLIFCNLAIEIKKGCITLAALKCKKAAGGCPQPWII